MSDKDVERERYDFRAAALFSRLGSGSRRFLGASAVRADIRAPYLAYEREVSIHVREGLWVLELGAGTGEFSHAILSAGGRLLAVDISSKALEVLGLRFRNFGTGTLSTQVGDIESLPLQSSSVDVVCGAGILSYGDNEAVRREIFRVLKPGGVFICVDSLGNNIIYNINRWLHYLFKRRSLNTLRRIPDLRLLSRYASDFQVVSISFFGSLVWVLPILRLIMKDERTSRFIDFTDQLIRPSRSAFKFVMVAKKNTVTEKL
ncbi:MAG: class I SAM-dependent methyltransferase [Gammaproteobacteria bacterium]|nr:class I SAM-dependent methyltransferase [Gammaproteobacteria bacterium]